MKQILYKASTESLLKEEEYEDILISKEVAEENVDENTLLVVVDTHKNKTIVEAPELLNKISKIVIIDHHRRSADYIEKCNINIPSKYMHLQQQS